MSQFSTMTTRERKMQAAAICREVQGEEDAQMDFGKKMSVPQDIMLEELSLTSNRGSRLFKMRQRRSEKYTFERIQNENNAQLNNSVVPRTENEHAAVSNSSEENMGINQTSKVTFDTPETKVVPDPSSIAPGYGGPLKDIPPEKFNSTAVPKSYHSPWEQAIVNDPALAATLITQLPEMEPPADLPGYKSFNRVATPFGGFSKAPTPAPIKAFQAESLPELPALQGESAVNRPSFNRSALGWVSSGGLAAFPTVPPEPLLVPESEDL
ncbi:myozenin-2a [Xenentodon cancila]